MSTFEGWSYWEFPLGDGWLVLALGAFLLACIVGPSMLDRRGWPK